MPYVFREELGEGEVAADVIERDIADAITDERDALIAERDGLVAERDGLAQELSNAKAKFADAFLSSPDKMKQNVSDDNKKDGGAYSFDQLFKGRNRANAN